MTGVENYVIVDKNVGIGWAKGCSSEAWVNLCHRDSRPRAPTTRLLPAQGVILRHSKGFTQDEAADFSGQLMELTQKAQHVVRDLEPRNELELFRVRGKEREILVAPGADFLVLILQRWRVAQLE